MITGIGDRVQRMAYNVCLRLVKLVDAPKIGEDPERDARAFEGMRFSS